jgi:AsmA-like C-terminal region
MIRKLLAGVAILFVIIAIAVVLFARGAIGGDTMRRALEAQLSDRVGQPVTIRTLGASFFPRVTVDLHDVAIGQPPAMTIAQVSVDTGLRGLLSRRVEDAEVIIANSRIPVEMALGIAGVVASGGTSTSTSGLTIVSVKTLAFRQVELVAGPHSLRVDLQSSLNGDRLDVTSLTAESAGTRLKATGALTSVSARQGRFSATAGRLNLDELLAVASSLSSATPTRPGTASALDLQIALTAPGGELGGYAFQSLSTTLHISPEQLLLRPLRFGIFGGEYDGQLEVMSARGAPHLALNGRVAGMNLATLLKDTRGSTSMSGKMGGNVALTADGTSSNEMLRTARGTGRVTIADGAIPGLEMVRSIVLAFGKPSGAPAPGSGSAFTRLDGPFTLADQTLRCTNITFASRDFDMTGSAVVRLPAGAIDMRANVVLSRDLTAQAGTDLRRYAQEDGRVVVPAIISGTVAAPSVMIDVAAAVNRALQNEVKRKVKGLLDRIIK